jgi:hypothetical protein
MVLVTRRRFVHQTAIATAALYGRPMKLLGGGRRIFGEREQNAIPIDAPAIRKLASQISGHVITPVRGEFLLMPRLACERVHDNGHANDTISRLRRRWPQEVPPVFWSKYSRRMVPISRSTNGCDIGT